MKITSKIATIAAAAVIVVGGSVAGVVAMNAGNEPEPKTTVKVEQKREAPVADVVEEQPAEISPEPVVEPAPAPVVEPAPAPAPPPVPAPAPSGAASGTPLPMVEKAPGYFDFADPTTFCASKSGATIGGVPSCA